VNTLISVGFGTPQAQQQVLEFISVVEINFEDKLQAPLPNFLYMLTLLHQFSLVQGKCCDHLVLWISTSFGWRPPHP
jgi:hypothetical protein